MSTDETETKKKSETSPPTRFFLKGLAISLPPILTLVILAWVASALNEYIIQPISSTVRYGIAQFLDESQPTRDFVKWDRLPPLDEHNRPYRITPELRQTLSRNVAAGGGTEKISVNLVLNNLEDENGRPQVFVPFGDKAVPYRDYDEVAERFSPVEMPATVTGLYMELVTLRYFGSQFALVAGAVAIVIVLLYFLGRFVTARVGLWAVHKTETAILGRLPLISHVYSSVKQVTDFFFSERTVEYNRVVAVQYPRSGVWSLGFVTSDSMMDITLAAGEPLVSVLMPTSPMPMTGFTINVPRSEVIDLNITIDQAFQYCLSCGVLIPEQQKVTPEALQQALGKRLTGEATSTESDGENAYSTPSSVQSASSEESL